MFRSTIRRLRRTLSFRSRSKHRGRNKSAGGGGNQNWEGDSVNIKSAGGCSFPAKVWKLRLQNALSEPSYVFRTILSLSNLSLIIQLPRFLSTTQPAHLINCISQLASYLASHYIYLPRQLVNYSYSQEERKIDVWVFAWGILKQKLFTGMSE